MKSIFARNVFLSYRLYNLVAKLPANRQSNSHFYLKTEKSSNNRIEIIHRRIKKRGNDNDEEVIIGRDVGQFF